MVPVSAKNTEPGAYYRHRRARGAVRLRYGGLSLPLPLFSRTSSATSDRDFVGCLAMMAVIPAINRSRASLDP